MKLFNNMRAVLKLTFGLLMVMLTITAEAQLKGSDSLFAFREFTKLGQIYKQLPVQLSIQIHNSANPITAVSDTMKSDLDLYYGKQNFYMYSEGLEEIVNDSLLIMVNNQTKEILIYPNDKQTKKNIEKSVSMFMPDSSIEIWARNYTSGIQDLGKNVKKIEIQSRENVSGTKFPKELITITYHQQPYEPLEFIRTKVNLLFADSTIYAGLQKNIAYAGKLVSSLSEKGNFFFLAKELTTTYSFKSINYNIQISPVNEQDRIVRGENGNYLPAKGFEEYVLTKEF